MLADGRLDPSSPFNQEIATRFTGSSCIRATTGGFLNVELNAIFFLGNLPV
jgi:hypothetical protein